MRILELSWRAGVVGAVVAATTVASAREGALAFLRSEHQTLAGLLRQPASPAREARVESTLSNLVDGDELARRAFGQPCPPSRPGCVNHWAALTAAQRAEVTPLLKKLVIKAERKNVLKTLDYDVDYKGEREAESQSIVHMEARSKLKPRDPPLLIDYVVASRAESWRVVDIVTEGSSRTKNYYEQFNRMLTTAGQGYPYVVAKLKENIAKKDAEAKETGEATEAREASGTR